MLVTTLNLTLYNIYSEIIRRNNVISDVMQRAFSSSEILLHFDKNLTHFWGACNPKKACKNGRDKFYFGRQIG